MLDRGVRGRGGAASVTSVLRLGPSGLLRIRHRSPTPRLLPQPATGSAPTPRTDAVRRVDGLNAVLPVPGRPRPSCSTSPAAGAASAARSATRSTTARTAPRVATRPHRARRDPAAGRGHAGLRLPARRGVGRARRLERRPRAPGRAPRRGRRAERSRRARRRRTARCPARSGWPRASRTPRPWVCFSLLRRRAGRRHDARPPLAAGPAGPPAADPARSSSTRGRPSTSTTTSTGSTQLAERAARDRGRAVRARRRLVRRPPRRHRRAWATGTSTPTCGRRACVRWPTRCAASAWSSGCGSSRRWSTPTPTWSARTRTGSSAQRPPATARPPALPWRHQHVLDLAVPQAYGYLLGRLDALVERDRHRLPQVGPQPRPARGAAPGADGVRRGGVHAQTLARVPAARRAARPRTPAWRSSPARPAVRGSTWRSWSTPTGCGPRTPTTRWSGSDPALDRAAAAPGARRRARRAAALAHHRPGRRPRASGA